MLILFDCDGVLVDSEVLATRELQRYLEDLSFPTAFEVENHDRFTGLSLRDIRTSLETQAGRSLPEDFERELRRRDVKAFQRDLRPINGVRDTLSALDLPRCVASSGSQEKIRHSLALTGLIDYFGTHLFSAHDQQVHQGKPAPDLFLHAAKSMGFKPNRCLVIEDSVAGVRAGIAAGMHTIGFAGGSHCNTDHPARLRHAGAHDVAMNMSTVTAIIDRIANDLDAS